MHSSTVSSGDSGANWYALYTKHQHERTVARNLTDKGFVVFLPLYAAARNWRDRVKLLYLPLFPCYVFVKGGLERRLDIVTTPGINAFVVSSGGLPAIISGDEIADIRQAIGAGARVEPHPFLRCGDWVIVRCGPLAGIRGVLVRKKSVYRLVVSIEMLGKSAAVEIDATSVERLNQQSWTASSRSQAGSPPGLANRTHERAQFLVGRPSL
jgi:transcription antitermination factor NusG